VVAGSSPAGVAKGIGHHGAHAVSSIKILFDEGTTAVAMNQPQNQAAWNLLGSITPDPAAGHKVVLSGDATAGSGQSEYAATAGRR
jgi:hypothetical protein